MGQTYSNWQRRVMPTGGWGMDWKSMIWKETMPHNQPPEFGPDFKDHSKKHFPEGARIRRPETYKIESAAELVDVEQRLAARGLKNPWLRNEVWRYERKVWGSPGQRTFFLLNSAKYGLAAFLVHWFFKEVVFGPSPPHHHHHYYEDYRKAPGPNPNKYRLVNEPEYIYDEHHH